MTLSELVLYLLKYVYKDCYQKVIESIYNDGEYIYICFQDDEQITIPLNSKI